MNTLERIECELARIPEPDLDKVLAFVESLAQVHEHPNPHAAQELTPEQDEALAHWNCS